MYFGYQDRRQKTIWFVTKYYKALEQQSCGFNYNLFLSLIAHGSLHNYTLFSVARKLLKKAKTQCIIDFRNLLPKGGIEDKCLVGREEEKSFASMSNGSFKSH